MTPDIPPTEAVRRAIAVLVRDPLDCAVGRTARDELGRLLARCLVRDAEAEIAAALAEVRDV